MNPTHIGRSPKGQRLHFTNAHLEEVTDAVRREGGDA